MKVTIAILTVLALFGIACSKPPPRPVFVSGERAATTTDGLRRLDGTGFQAAWVRPGVAFSAYDRVKLIHPDIAYRKPPQHSARGVFGNSNYALPAGVAADFMSALDRRFREELVDAGLYHETDALGPRVLVVRLALVDLVINAPLAHLSDDDLNWIDALGDATVTIDLYDAASLERLGHFAERRWITTASDRPIRARPSDAVYEMSRIARGWARQLQQLIEVLRQQRLAAR
jgi:hypothetical protein